MIYEEVIERASLAVKNLFPSEALPRIRVAVEAQFITTLREVCQVFAGTSKGDQLRQDVPLTFVSGFIAAPDKVLLKHLKRARLFTSDPNAYYSFENEGADLANLDKRLGYWKITGTTIEARTPTDGSYLDGSATLDAICVPEIDLTQDVPLFTGPADMIPEFIDALAAKVAGTMRKAA